MGNEDSKPEGAEGGEDKGEVDENGVRTRTSSSSSSSGGGGGGNAALLAEAALHTHPYRHFLAFSTDGQPEYRFHHMCVREPTMVFAVRTAGDAHLALIARPRFGCLCHEIILGNTRSFVRERILGDNTDVEGEILVDAPTPEAMSNDEAHFFWVSWAATAEDGDHPRTMVLRVGKGAVPFHDTVMSFSFDPPLLVLHVGVCTVNAPGDWYVWPSFLGVCPLLESTQGGDPSSHAATPALADEHWLDFTLSEEREHPEEEDTLRDHGPVVIEEDGSADHKYAKAWGGKTVAEKNALMKNLNMVNMWHIVKDDRTERLRVEKLRQDALAKARAIQVKGAQLLHAFAQSDLVEMPLEDAFRKVDEDGSGSIDADEVAKLYEHVLGKTLDEDSAVALLTVVDANGDGSVSLEEFQGLLSRAPEIKAAAERRAAEAAAAAAAAAAKAAESGVGEGNENGASDDVVGAAGATTSGEGGVGDAAGDGGAAAAGAGAVEPEGGGSPDDAPASGDATNHASAPATGEEKKHKHPPPAEKKHKAHPPPPPGAETKAAPHHKAHPPPS